ncbi:MAG: right-handed parallel beta-helix repeat-containing protein [Thermodesulfobacteriota bacterium]|nr:right-handed parallel beta-helix repeat-containing protein [Thermodesulfobacteriota bacterium]
MRNDLLRLVFIRAVLLSFLVMILSLSLTSVALGKPLVIEKGIIKSDTTWQNEVIIRGDVEIAEGATLVIMPGTVVKFAKIQENGPANLEMDKAKNFTRAELIINGRILAQGTKDKVVVFTSAEKSPSLADWGAINMLESDNNIFEYCDISYGHTAVHGHGAQFTVANCYLHDNGVAIGFKNVDQCKPQCVTVLYNHITRNGGGVLCSRDSRAVVSHNQIDHNKFFGIYGKMGSHLSIRYNHAVHNGKGVIVYAMKGLQLRENNISDNDEYNISLMEGQIWNVDARHNWWGTPDTKIITALIWDKDEEVTLGTVDFSGFADSPIDGAGLPR